MARARSASGEKWFNRPYSRAYARTTGVWQTRTGRRNKEFATFANLLGLNTAFDELHKGDGGSPYLRNVRYMGEKQLNQRAQATSRAGARLLHSIGDKRIYPEQSDAQTEIEIWEGRAVEFDIEISALLIGGMFYIHNYEGAKGILRVILKETPDSRPLCDAVINLEDMDKLKFRQKEFRFIQGIEPNSSNEGRVTIRLEVFDDIEPIDCYEEYPYKSRKIKILARGDGSHRAADYELPNVNECMKEIPYEYTQQPNIPMMGQMTNDTKTLPRGIQTCCNGKDILIYPVLQDGEISLYRQELPHGFNGVCSCDIPSNKRCKKISTPGSAPVKLNAPVHPKACAVRFTEADGYVYYVDGISPLRRIQLCTWISEDAVPLAEDIDTELATDPASLTAKPGASLILKLNNRIYLAGFPDDPNFVQHSLIDSEGAKFDQFNEGFYSPNKSPKESACTGITALNQLENTLVVFRRDGSSAYSGPTGTDFGKAQQVDTFAWNIGVDSQEAVAEGNGNIYFWNRSEGFRRYAGTDTSFQSQAIDNELRNIGDNDNVFMIAHANKVRFYFDRERRGYPDHCFVYHTVLARSFPWYMDDQTPLMWAVGDKSSDRIYGMHSQYAATYIVDYTERNDVQFTDFNSSIIFRYHTQYKAPGSLAGWTYLRRAILKIIASSTNSWFIGIDKNHEDAPSVWRKFVVEQVDQTDNPDSLMGNVSPAGTSTISIFCRKECRDLQFRVAVICYRSQAELIYLEGQYGGKDSL